MSAAQYDSAASYFQRAIAANPASRISYEGLAKAYGKQKRFKSQIETLQRALELWPKREKLLLMLGDAYAVVGNDDAAAAAFRGADRDDGTIALRIGTQAARGEEWSRARGHYETALKHSDQRSAHSYSPRKTAGRKPASLNEALDAYRKAATLDSTAAEAFTGIGEVYLKHGSYGQAIAALERAVEIEPDEAQSVAASRPGVLRERANTSSPQQCFGRRSSWLPDEAEQYHNLGMVYQQLQAWPEAERAYAQALQRNGRLSQSHFNLGYIYLQEKRYEEAIAACQRVLELDPEQR